jgi:DNA topoisomerase-1
MADFAKVLPEIRARVKRDLAKQGLQKEKVLATIVRLLETTLIRVGNEEYSKHNNSFGLTTLRNHHVHITGPKVDFYFRGKSGRRHAISVQDAHLAKIVRRLRDLPGYELFQYVDEAGETRSVGSSDVNDYLREITHDDFTAKDFRTWAGTVLAVEALCECKPCTTSKQAKRNIVSVVEKVADKLGNTVAVCKKCYIHPAVFEAYMQSTSCASMKVATSCATSKSHSSSTKLATFSKSKARIRSEFARTAGLRTILKALPTTSRRSR